MKENHVMIASKKNVWPDNKKFAFTILDDTDCSTLKNAPLVYDFLYECGLRTTKSVWMFEGEIREDNKKIVGTTCQNEEYLNWVLGLQSRGFEIAYHSTSFSRSKRNRVIDGLYSFKKYFGDYPRVLAQHNDTQKNESIYWGANRLSGLNKLLYRIMTFYKRNKNIYYGHINGDEYFWGDYCRDNIKYVRNFVFPDINTLKSCPFMPYHDTKRHYVNYWFASSEGPNVSTFNKCISEANQDRLEEENGACIMYTHFGTDFVENGSLNKRFEQLISRISQKDGWFVSVEELLDYLLEINGHHNITNKERSSIERRWLLHKLNVGGT